MSDRQSAITRDDVEQVSSDVANLMARIEAAGHQRVWLVGGGKLVSRFHRLGLINEYRLFLIPLTLGEGIALFSEQQSLQQLEFCHSRTHPNSVIELNDRPVFSSK